LTSVSLPDVTRTVVAERLMPPRSRAMKRCCPRPAAGNAKFDNAAIGEINTLNGCQTVAKHNPAP
jgi:hypothetical protein